MPSPSLPPTTTETGRTAIPRVLTIAGSDSCGGAGIQADLKSIAAHGGYGMSAVTALTAQNTHGVRGVHVPPAGFLAEQLRAVADDIAIDAVKIGMLANDDVTDAVREWLSATRPAVVVLDPVMVATSGDRLLAGDARTGLLSLLPLVHLVTPNLPELAALVGEPEALSWEEAVAQGKRLAVAAQVRVLVKGGHLPDGDDDECPDALVAPDGAVEQFTGPRVHTANTHGTGCSLSAAVATLQAAGGDWSDSVRTAKAWLTDALAASDELHVGSGRGPVNHLHRLWVTAAPLGDQFSRTLWRQIEPIRAAILDLAFLRELSAGTLAAADFAYYLAQDARYLNAYSRVLARASALAPTEDEQRFWAGGAQNCLVVEMELHRAWLADRSVPVDLGPVTKAYVDHLHAAAGAGSYAEVVAAVLPCYWLYAEVGRLLHTEYQAFDGPHAYGAWLETYADEAFAEATRQAIAIVDKAAREGSVQDREKMRTAFLASARYELDFFAAPALYA